MVTVMAVLLGIDGFIVARLTTVCHALQRWTGRTNFYWMARTLDVVTIGMCINLVSAFGIPLVYIPESLWFKLVLPFVVVVAVWRRTQAMQLAYEVPSVLPRWLMAERAPIKFNAPFRLLYAVLAVLSYVGYRVLEHQPYTIWMTFDRYIMPGLSLVQYLAAVDPLPPCRGKVQAWVRSLFTFHVPREVPHATR